MAVSATGVLTPDDLNGTDEAVLDVLCGGRVTPQYAAERMDVSRTYASERLKRLVEHNHVQKVAPGLYELVDDPRDDVDVDQDDVAELERRIEDGLDWIDATIEAINEPDGDLAEEHAEAARVALQGGDDERD